MDNLPALVNYANVDGSRSIDLLAAPRNTLTFTFSRYLLQKAMSVFEWKMPETWNRDFFLYVLYGMGRIAIVNTDRYGVIPQPCGLMGYNIFYQPTNAIVVNPLLSGMLNPRIDVDCVLLKLQPDYGGILDLVSIYANLLAQAAQSTAVSLNNSKAAILFFARNDAVANSYKRAFDQMSNGQPAVVLDKGLFDKDGSPQWDTLVNHARESYIVDDLLRDMRRIENMFDTDVGIPNANLDKRERMITDEVNANNVETISKCALWLEELRQGCEKARNMFGVELSVDWRKYQDMREEGEENGTVYQA